MEQPHRRGAHDRITALALVPLAPTTIMPASVSRATVSSVSTGCSLVQTVAASMPAARTVAAASSRSLTICVSPDPPRTPPARPAGPLYVYPNQPGGRLPTAGRRRSWPRAPHRRQLDGDPQSRSWPASDRRSRRRWHGVHAARLASRAAVSWTAQVRQLSQSSHVPPFQREARWTVLPQDSAVARSGHGFQTQKMT